MTDSSDNKYSYNIIPPGLKRCVWMNAGIISYQLCDREYECDLCPLDLALRRNFVHDEARGISKEKMPDKKTAFGLRREYRYTENHFWVKTVYNDYLRVGLEPNFTKVVLNAKAVVLPSPGQTVTKGLAAGWIISEHGVLPILSPLSGRVINVNPNLSSNPQALFKAPFESGWLFELTPGSDELKGSNLLGMAEAEKLYKSDALKFKDMLVSALNDKSIEVGPTLADGGAPLQNLADNLEPEKYYEIVKEVFLHKQAKNS